jgi:hypothetical protein
MKSIEEYRQDLAERLGLEVVRLHFEARPGSPPSFDVKVDGNDLSQEQERVVVAFVSENPYVGRAREERKPPQPPQPKVQCQFCKEVSVGSARVGDRLQYFPHCADHAERATVEADRVLQRIGFGRRGSQRRHEHGHHYHEHRIDDRHPGLETHR